MTAMLNATPIDYVIWVSSLHFFGTRQPPSLTCVSIAMQGNHEDDLPHKDVVQRCREYKGVWINSNMQDHQLFKEGSQKAYEIVDIGVPGSAHSRRVGLIGVLSDTPSLYASLPVPPQAGASTSHTLGAVDCVCV